MDITNITEDFDNITFTNCTDIQNFIDINTQRILLQYDVDFRFYVY